MKLYPVGSRPHCLFCREELAPQFKTPLIPYELWGDPEKKAQFREDHPKVFTGTYGRYGDNRFCGLTCGWQWAVKFAPLPPE